MDIDTPEQKYKKISYEGPGFRELTEQLKSDPSASHLCLFLGLYEPDKNEAITELAEKLEREVTEIDLSKYVSRNETDTYRSLDAIFERYRESNDILYFRNGDRLCGVYTNYTHSRVKYASPQERYFLEKSREHEGLVIVDISEFTAADKTIRRAAHSIVRFTLPGSPLKRFLWHLKNYSLHGFELKSKRPDAYSDTAENF